VEKSEFNEWLKKAGLKKSEFAEMVGLKPESVTNWGNRGKPIPKWVRPFLQNLCIAKTVESLKDVLCDIEDGKK